MPPVRHEPQPPRANGSGTVVSSDPPRIAENSLLRIKRAVGEWSFPVTISSGALNLKCARPSRPASRSEILGPPSVPTGGCWFGIFHLYTGGSEWSNSDGWLSNQPLGEWHGVTVNGQGEVTTLALNRNGLTGAIPSELSNLSSLSIIGLANTDICAPDTEAFRDWLDTVADKPGGVQTCE